jgi:hypothetical protein
VLRQQDLAAPKALIYANRDSGRRIAVGRNGGNDLTVLLLVPCKKPSGNNQWSLFEWLPVP